MALLNEWQKLAERHSRNQTEYKNFWEDYFEKETKTYKRLLGETEPVSGTVEELAEKYGLSLLEMTGFLDGINDSLTEANPVDTIEKDTVVNLVYDKEKLYYNMVGAQADWLYELPEWNDLLSEERRAELYKEEKSSHTIRKPKKIGRNDPCPCGSGKKYKNCCGR